MEAWIVEAHGTLLICHWLVQYSRCRRTIWTFKLLKALFCYNASTLLVCGNMWFDTNILMMHPIGVPTIRKKYYHDYILHNFHSWSFSVPLAMLLGLLSHVYPNQYVKTYNYHHYLLLDPMGIELGRLSLWANVLPLFFFFFFNGSS